MAAGGGDSDISIDKVMLKIFTACDKDDSGKAQVSHLINYITPFMQENLANLMELKKSLDPHNVDPMVEQETFFEEMKTWASKFSADIEEVSDAENFRTISPNCQFKFDPSCNSTPRPSFGSRFIKGYLEVSSQNLSCNFQQESCSGEINKTYFEDQIKELMHQNKKNSEELLHVKLQLISSEEQNDLLQKDIKLLTKQLSQERDVYENLQKELSEFEELRECSNTAQKQIDKVQKLLENTEKDNALLHQKIKILENDKQQYEEKIKQLHLKHIETKNSLIELSTELSVKEKEVLDMENLNLEMKAKLDDQVKVMDYYKELNDCLVVEKTKLKNMLYDRIKQQRCGDNGTTRSQSFCEYEKPIKILPALNFARRHSLATTTSITLTTPLLPTPISTTPIALTPTTPTPTSSIPSPTTIKFGIAFNSPIKTRKFKFYNKDCPVARTCNSSPSKFPNKTPTNQLDFFTSHPNNTKSDLEHVGSQNFSSNTNKSFSEGDSALNSNSFTQIEDFSEKEVDTKANNSLSTLNDSIEDEIYLQKLTCNINNSPHESLHSELLQVNEMGKLNDINALMEYCNQGIQVEIITLDTVTKLKEEIKNYVTQLSMITKDKENDVNILEMEIKKLQEELSKTHEKEEVLKNKEEEFKLLIQKYESDAINLKKDLENMKEVNQHLMKDHELTEKLHTKKIKVLENRLTTEECKYEAVNCKMHNMKNTMESNFKRKEMDLLKKLKQLEEEQDITKIDLLNKISDLEKEKQFLNDEIFSSKNRIEELQNKYDKALSKWNLQFGSYKNLEEDLKLQITELTKENEKLKTEISKSELVLKEQLEDSKIEQADMEIKYLTSCGEIDKLQSNLELSKLQSNELVNVIKFKEAELSECKKLIFNYEEKISELQNTISSISDWNESIKLGNKTLNDKLETVNKTSLKEIRPRGVNHGKMAIKLEKLQNENEYLKEQLKAERSIKEELVQKLKISHSCVTNKLSIKLTAPAVRPVSPDSPNLELSNDNEVTVIENCKSITTSKVDCAESLNVANYSQEVSNVLLERVADNLPLQILHNLEQKFEDIQNESVSEEELEKIFDNFILQFTLDRSTIKERCEVASSQLNQEEMKLLELIRNLVNCQRRNLTGNTLVQTENMMELLLQSSLHLLDCAEKFGTLKAEYKFLKTTNLFINYTDILRNRLNFALTPSKCVNCINQLVSVNSIGSNNQDNLRSFKVFMIAITFFALITTFFFAEYFAMSVEYREPPPQ